MSWNCITPTIPILAGIAAGFTCIICFSQLIDNVPFVNRFLRACGRNTYEIMSLSQISIALMNLFISNHPIIKYLLLVSVLYTAIQIRHIILVKIKSITSNEIHSILR